MKWVMLSCSESYSESYSEETKCIELKIYPFSSNQECYQTNNIWKLLRFIYNFSAFLYAKIPAESTSYEPTFFKKLNMTDLEYE